MNEEPFKPYETVLFGQKVLVTYQSKEPVLIQTPKASKQWPRECKVMLMSVRDL